MTPTQRVVFDCNVFFQALIGPSGPARKLLKCASDGTLTLFVSSHVLEELRDVLSRPEIRIRYRLTEHAISEFFVGIVDYSTLLDPVPHVFDLPRDPDDAHYIDLAIAANAKLVVSRDKDLIALSDTTTEKGAELSSRFPGLRILTPPELLRLLAENDAPR